MGQSESRPVLTPGTSIDDLPPEIIEGIAQYLGPDDLHSFHKASRYTHNSTLIVIRRLALSTMRTDLSTPSLNALDQISRQPIVARHVRKLMVVLDSSPPAGEGRTWVRNSIGELDPAGLAFRQLQGILKRFRNCDSFEISGPKARSSAEPGHLSGQEAIAVIIRTIIDAKRSVYSLKVCLPDTTWVFRRPGERYIEADGFIERTLGELEVSEVWASIQELAVGYVYSSYLEPSAVLRLLEPAKELQSLSLGQHEPRYWDSFVGSAISTPLAFQLRSLTIHRQMLVEDPAEPCLKDFVYRQRDTLETVRFADVHLSSLDSWRLVLNTLEGCLHLEEISLDRIGVDVLAQSHARFAHGVGVFGLCKRRYPNFTLHRSPRRLGPSVIHGVSYAGPKMQAAIRSIGRNMRLP